MGQGNDRGSQYRSGFYTFDDEQRQLVEASAKVGVTVVTVGRVWLRMPFRVPNPLSK